LWRPPAQLVIIIIMLPTQPPTLSGTGCDLTGCSEAAWGDGMTANCTAALP